VCDRPRQPRLATLKRRWATKEDNGWVRQPVAALEIRPGIDAKGSCRSSKAISASVRPSSPLIQQAQL